MPRITGTETVKINKTGFPALAAMSELREYFNPIVTVLAADASGSNVATVQAVFPTNGTFSAQDRTLYKFEAYYNITRTAGTTSHTFAILFGGTATFTAIDYLAEVANPSGNILGAASFIVGAAASAVTLTAANTSATENIRVRLNGMARVDIGGTIIPQFQYSAAPGGAPTIKRGSFFSMLPLGSRDLAAIGIGWA